MGSLQEKAASAQMAAADESRAFTDKQTADLAKKNAELQLKNEAIAKNATDAYNRRRRGLTGQQSLIGTSEAGTFGLGTGKSLLG